jgi:CRP-like cAMP-binding protein
MSFTLAALEMLLRNFGPLRSEAWEAIYTATAQRVYSSAKAIHLEAGGMIYVGEGLLKQYARAERTQPGIIRFLQAGEVLFAPYEVNSIYVKTIQRSTLYYWNEHTLRQLIASYPEVLKMYMRLRDLQEGALDFKVLLLEQEVKAKLLLFDQHYPKLRLFIKNKDLANFLHVSESTLSRSKR